MSYEVSIAYTDRYGTSGKAEYIHDSIPAVLQDIGAELAYRAYHYGHYGLTQITITITHRPASVGAERSEKGTLRKKLESL